MIKYLPFQFVGVPSCLIFAEDFYPPLTLAISRLLPDTRNRSAIPSACDIEIAMCSVKNCHQSATAWGYKIMDCSGCRETVTYLR